MNDKDLFGDQSSQAVCEPIEIPSFLERRNAFLKTDTKQTVDKNLAELVDVINKLAKPGTGSHTKAFLKEKLIADIIMIQAGIDKLANIK